MRTIYSFLTSFLLLALFPKSLKASAQEDLLRCLSESAQFTLEEKEVLAANVRRYSRFGNYAVTANNTRASGIAVAVDAQKSDMVFRAVELKAIAAFANVFHHVWEEEFDALDGMMSVRGRFPAIRQLRVFHGRVAPQAVIRERRVREDGSELMILFIPADKVIIERDEYKKEFCQRYAEALFGLYAVSYKDGETEKCAQIKNDFQIVGLDAPDETLLDYLKALADDDEAAAAVLLEEVVPVFRQLPQMMKTAVLKIIAGSQRKEDALLFVEDKDKTTKELK